MGSSTYNEALQKELERELMDAGNKLLTIPSSTKELLFLLEKVESLLAKVFQQPPKSTEDALVPAMKALVADKVLHHADVKIKVAVASCINELTRISAPDQPYNDDKMNEVFQLFMAALKHLSFKSGSNYLRALQILETMAMVRSFLIMMDIDSDATIVEMFQIFFNTIRSNSSSDIFKYMENIMSLVIEESDEISLELLRPLLDSVKMDNKDISPISWDLGKSLFERYSTKIQPYLRDAVKAMKLKIDDYAEIVASLCKDTSNGNNMVVKEVLETENIKEREISLETLKCCKQIVQNKSSNATSDAKEVNNAETNAIRHDTVQPEANAEIVHAEIARSGIEEVTCAETVQLKSKTSPDFKEPSNAEILQSDTDIGPLGGKRSRRKPNSLMKPEEGYEHTWMSEKKGSFKLSHDRKNRDRIDIQSDSAQKESASIDEGSIQKRVLSKKKESMMSQHDDQESLSKVLRKIVQSKGNERGSNTVKKTAKRLPSGSSLQLSVEKGIKNETRDVEDEMVESLMPKTKPAKKKPCGSLAVEKEKKTRKSGVHHGEDLVNARIMVWWPMDETFYTGTVEAFDPLTKKHKIKYDDDEEEVLNLNEEKWELFSYRPTRQIQTSQRQESDHPSPAKDELIKTQQTTSKRKPGSSRKQRKPTSSKRSKTESPSLVKCRDSSHDGTKGH